MYALEIATSHVYPKTTAMLNWTVAVVATIGQKKYFREIAAAKLEKQLTSVTQKTFD